MAKGLTGWKIRELRKGRGMSQAELARRIGISASYLNLIECNKRAAAGILVDRIAAGLAIDRSILDGEAERRLVAGLEEIAADRNISGSAFRPGPAEELVGRNPGWADLVLRLYQAWLDQSTAVLALADRLNRDPFLGDSVHRMLTRVTSIQSAAEILAGDDALVPAERRRFLSIAAGDARKLADDARSLLDFFDSTHMRIRSATPAEQVDAFIFATGNYFPELEEIASGFLTRHPGIPDAAAEDVLKRRSASPPSAPAPQNAETLRFLLFKEALREDAADVVQALVADHPALGSQESANFAASALHSYVAAAVVMPYERFLEAAETHRYDLDALCALFRVSYEQAAHRLATLRRRGAEGVRFAFMRSDVSGYVTKRLPLPRLPLPRYGNACPLWMVHAAFQSAGVTARSFGELPSGEQFLFFARAVEKRRIAVGLPRHLVSVMLACSAADAMRVVYGDGIDRARAMIPVGTVCRLCPRAGCAHRQEAPLISYSRSRQEPAPDPIRG